MQSSDPHNLQRFIDAQRDSFDAALDELRSGRKRGHWMWFIFPQLAGLGRSPTATFYALGSADEARAYLDHPLLGPRLRHVVETLLASANTRSADEMLGQVDAMKLGSSLTLFDAVAADDLFRRALAAFFDGADERTLALLAQRR